MKQANAATTLAKACKSIVLRSLDLDYIAQNWTPELGYKTLASIYQTEYGYNGVSPKACMEYLQGLPSVCTVPFTNSDILELLEAQGISRKTEDGQCALIEKYWQECGKQFYLLIK